MQDMNEADNHRQLRVESHLIFLDLISYFLSSEILTWWFMYDEHVLYLLLPFYRRSKSDLLNCR